eukprot:5595667-Prymnesium_polylepis.1
MLGSEARRRLKAFGSEMARRECVARVCGAIVRRECVERLCGVTARRCDVWRCGVRRRSARGDGQRAHVAQPQLVSLWLLPQPARRRRSAVRSEGGHVPSN